MGLKFLLFIFAFFLFSFPLVETSFAAKIQRCRDDKPATAPVITDAIPGNNSVKLIWTEGEGPLTHYLLEYGPSKDQMIYGAQNIGPKGTTEYTVEGLINGTKYYFRVHAINNCRHKDSHTVSAIAGVGASIQKGIDLPRLSFYKTDAATVSSFSQENSKGAAVPVAIENKVTECAEGCYGMQLLVLEFITLLLFFFVTHRYPIVRPLYALVIPFIFAFIFYLLNKECTANGFLCQYFYILNVTIFILVISLQRQRLMHKAMKETNK